jgi:hypothetical protein
MHRRSCSRTAMASSTGPLPSPGRGLSLWLGAKRRPALPPPRRTGRPGRTRRGPGTPHCTVCNNGRNRQARPRRSGKLTPAGDPGRDRIQPDDPPAVAEGPDAPAVAQQPPGRAGRTEADHRDRISRPAVVGADDALVVNNPNASRTGSTTGLCTTGIGRSSTDEQPASPSTSRTATTRPRRPRPRTGKPYGLPAHRSCHPTGDRSTASRPDRAGTAVPHARRVTVASAARPGRSSTTSAPSALPNGCRTFGGACALASPDVRSPMAPIDGQTTSWSSGARCHHLTKRRGRSRRRYGRSRWNSSNDSGRSFLPRHRNGPPSTRRRGGGVRSYRC